MFVTEANYKSIESSPHEEVSLSDVENVSVSPNDTRVTEILNSEQSIVEDRLTSRVIKNDESKSWTMAKVQVGYDVTRKGERSLVVDGFKFTKSRDGTNNRVFWRCSRRECKATAVTVCDRVEHVRAIHAHEPPLAAEFFGSHEGVLEHCELQEVRFNTNAANMRPRYRRTNLSLSESNPEDPTIVKDISNSTSNFRNNGSPVEQQSSQLKLETISPQYKLHNIEIKPASYMLQNCQPKPTNSVKDQVRDFILRNSAQISTYPQNNGVSVAQFLIAPAPQSPYLQNNNNNSVSSSIGTSNTAFNFNNPMHINAALSINNGSDSTSDISSYKSTPPGMINVPATLHSGNTVKNHSSSDSVTNQMQMEQILQLLIKNGCHARQQQQQQPPQPSSSDSDWSSPTPGPGIQQCELPTYNSPSAMISSDGNQASVPSRFMHWKKERLCDTDMTVNQVSNDRKRRYDNSLYDSLDNPKTSSSSTTTTATGTEHPSPDSDTKQLCSFLTSVRPVITMKLIAAIQKLTSELRPEEAVAQEVFEKCTAIRTCLETLEKLHSLTLAV